MNDDNLFFVAILSEDQEKLEKLEQLFNSCDKKINQDNFDYFLTECDSDEFTEDTQQISWCEIIDDGRLELSGSLEKGLETEFWRKLSEVWDCEVKFEYHSEKDNLALTIDWESGTEMYYDEISCVKYYFFNDKESFWEKVEQWGWSLEDFESELGEYLDDWQLEELKKIL